MSFPEFSIQRPVTVLMACLVAILLGAIAFVEIPVDLMPETEFPTLSVNVAYEGVAPEEMETLVVRPLEQSLASAPFLEEITSTASEGQANVRLRYAYGIDLDEAANDLRSRIDRRRNTLPDDIDPPVLYKFDISQFPIMFLTVASDKMDPKELRHFTEKSIQYRVERVPGVAQARVSGGLRRQIHVNLSLKKMRALNLSMAQVVQTLQAENLNRPVGPVNEGRYEVLLRTQGEFKSVNDILGVGVTDRNGVPVYIRDIATVDDSHEDVRYLVGVNGKPAVRLFIYKQSGANTVDVSEQVHHEIEQIQNDYPGISIDSPWDSAEFIRASIKNVQGATVVGGGLAIVVLLFFLRSVTSTLIIGTAIPISVIATFALMYFNGFTLNTVSFGGLALGVGMLVDNSIVVLENIYRHREEGKGAKEAAVVGSREVVMAITASTLTTIAVFVPVLFMGGYSAQTFQQLAWVVSFSLFCSLMVSITIVPVLSSRFLHATAKKDARGLGRWVGDMQDRMTESYGRVVEWSVDHRMAISGVAVGLFAVSLYLAPLIGIELEPELDEGTIQINIELEPGTRAEVTNEVVQRLERTIREKVPEVKYTMTEAGSNGGWRVEGTNSGQLRIELVDRSERNRSAADIAKEIRAMLGTEPGMTVQTRIQGGIRHRGGSFGDDRLSVEIRGHDLQIAGDLAQQVQHLMQTTPGIVSSEISQKPGMPEMVVQVDRAKATSMGLKVSDVADALETAIGGTRASMFREDGDEYDILVRLQEGDRLAVGQVGDVSLTLPDGKTVAAQSVVHMRRQEGPFQITRADQQRIIVVNGNIADRDLGSIVEELSGKLANIPRPPGYEFRFGGEYKEQQEAFRSLTFAAILALVLVYMVMASQFESLRDPFIILFSIPLAFIGVVFTLLLTKTTFNIQGFLGVIVLVGIVVNNAIVLIDYTNLLRREQGYSLRDAVITGGRTRLRPILMTTVTTVLGLMPMALGLGEGGELQAPMARVVIGGLTTSTLITLVFIPMVYMTVEEFSERAKARRERAAAGSHEGLEPAPTTGD